MTNIKTLKELLILSLKELSEIKELESFPDYSSKAEHFRKRIEDNEFRVAVVGEFSSGKSTFINAIIGTDILKHGSTETTATLTRIVNVSKEDTRYQTGIVFMQNSENINLDDLSKLTQYTTTSSEIDVVNNVESVELYLNMLDSKDNLVIVDTPGLNGMADGHREQTFRLIEESHSCIYLLQRRGLADSDINFLKELTNIQLNFIFVQNFVDELRKDEGDSIDKKLAKQKEILDSEIFNKIDNANYSICGVSALLELVYRDKSITRLYSDSTNDLTNEERKNLHSRSNFEEFRQIINTKFGSNNLDKIKYGDTAQAFLNWIYELRNQAERYCKFVNELYEASIEHDATVRLEEMKQKLIDGKSQRIRKIKNFVVAQCVEIRQKGMDELEQHLKKIREDLCYEIQLKKSIEAMENYQNQIANIIKDRIENAWRKIILQASMRIQEAQQILLARIDKYTGIKNEHSDLADLKLQNNRLDINQFQPKQDSIEKDKADIARLEENKKHMSNEDRHKVRSKKDEEIKLSLIKNKQEKVEDKRKIELANLGSRPKPNTYEESYYVEEERGRILNFFLGPKKVKKWRSITDDSSGQRWDVKIAEIKNAYLLDISKLKEEEERQKRKLKNIQTDIERNSVRINETDMMIEAKKKHLKEAEKILEAKKEQIKKEYLEGLKKNVTKQVANYLGLPDSDDSALGKLGKDISKITDTINADLIKWAIETYDKVFEKRINMIEDAQQSHGLEMNGQVEAYMSIINQLTVIEERIGGVFSE